MKSIEIFNNTRDANGQFQTGYRATIGTKYVTIEYLTNIQGHYDMCWKLTIADFNNVVGETIFNKILTIAAYYKPCKVGDKIQ